MSAVVATGKYTCTAHRENSLTEVGITCYDERAWEVCNRSDYLGGEWVMVDRIGIGSAG